ncbi:hypothetical protein K504DRAFT_445389 [Pleomassaria siparia CBS 279.74]|uniref:Uncharacterized protein n=1 Tax=Pleomassaria siparia CBS 279.74 TaxID=1314801 RepID=A0A6G1KPR6_9PLEO|nr:hypothetical protein K504DRAFT_445389 [Pleomassaria siparia CBS 279.74]
MDKDWLAIQHLLSPQRTCVKSLARPTPINFPRFHPSRTMGKKSSPVCPPSPSSVEEVGSFVSLGWASQMRLIKCFVYKQMARLLAPGHDSYWTSSKMLPCIGELSPIRFAPYFVETLRAQPTPTPTPTPTPRCRHIKHRLLSKNVPLVPLKAFDESRKHSSKSAGTRRALPGRDRSAEDCKVASGCGLNEEKGKGGGEARNSSLDTGLLFLNSKASDDAKRNNGKTDGFDQL